MKSLILLIALMGTAAADELVITTWNLETIGAASGRGWAQGYGQGQLPPRTNPQLAKLATMIRDTLQSDIVAIQEVAITHRSTSSVPRCRALDRLVSQLGQKWTYWLPWVDTIPDDHANQFPAFLYNEDRVRRVEIFAMEVTSPFLAGAELFSRRPLVGYFEALSDGQPTNDFVIVNLHLKSGQDHDENHLIAMTVLEWNLTRALDDHGIHESDRIILGDFNDNPYAKKSNGKPVYSDALYQHMAFKGYRNLVTPDVKTTRMNKRLNSIIDHILVNTSAARHISQSRADVYNPPRSASDFHEALSEWRKTYSDHFPISFKLKIERSDDDTDF